MMALTVVLALLATPIPLARVASAGIEPGLACDKDLAEPGQRFEVLLALREFLDTRPLLLSGTDKSGQRRAVVQALQQHASESQAGLRSLLDILAAVGEVSDIVPLWIANAVYCRASARAIDRIAARPDIWFIGSDRVPMACGSRLETAAGGFPPTDDVGWNVRRIKADSVWLRFGLRGEGVVVGHIDGGCDYTHPDLASHMWTDSAYPFHGWNFANDNDNPMDTNGHGTHTAGTVAGDGTGGTATGIAPRARIMVCRVKTLYTQPGPDTVCENTMLRAMEFCIAPPASPDNGADLVTMSMGLHHTWRPRRALFRQAATNLAAAGLPLFVAAGNDGWGQPPDNITTPADVPGPWKHPAEAPGGLGGAIAVAATDQRDSVAEFSSRGPVSWTGIAPYNDYPYPPGLLKPDLSAPGVNVASCRIGGGYYASSGTSMATPAVAGVCALMLEKNPGLSPRAVDSILQNSVVPLSSRPKTDTAGTGRVDALLAVEQTRYGAPHHDIALTGLVAPGALVNQREPVVPRLTVTNRGTFREYGVEFHCRVESAGVAVYQQSTTLASIDTVVCDTVSFPAWNVGPGFQSYRLTCWHSLANDTSRFNDTLVAITVSRGHDAAISFTNFRPKLLAGRRLSPIIYVDNRGHYEETDFSVHCLVESAGVTVFRDSAVVAVLPESGQARCQFAEWAVGPQGAVYNATVWHELATDERRQSDTVRAHSTASERLAALVIYSDHATPETLVAGLRRLGDSVATYDAHDQTPRLADLLGFDAVAAFDNFTFLDPAALGDTLAAFADRGGGVVLGEFCFTTGWRMQGRIMTNQHATLVPGATNFRLDSLGPHRSSHPVMAGVQQVADFYRASATLAAGAETIARWRDGRPFVAVSASRKVVGLNQYPGSIARPDQRFGDWVLVWHNALHFAATASAAGITAPPQPVELPGLTVGPNPAGRLVRFDCRLGADERGRLAIIDLGGRTVRSFEIEGRATGPLTWDLSDDHGRRLPAGVYFCRLSSTGHSSIRKLVVR